MLVSVALTGAAGSARADGDPGSDVLLYSNLFFEGDANISIAQQVQLGDLLDATTAAHAPVRVAIIAKPDDLGSVTSLWQRPAEYAKYLGIEVSGAYDGRLLIVMPGGLGVDYKGAPDLADDTLLAGIHPGAGASSLVAAAQSGVRRLEAAAGVTLGPLRGAPQRAVQAARSATTPNGEVAPVPAATGSGPASRGVSASRGGHPSAVLVGLVLVLALSAPLWLRAVVRRARGSALGGQWVLPGAAGVSLAVAFAAVVVVLHDTSATQAAGATQAADLARNPNLDPGEALRPVAAPDFTLTDQFGRSVRLSQFRGKVVLLAFNDAECQTICPLTTVAMLDAKRALGAAGDQLQLLGVDANSRSISIADVLSYSELHGMTTAWHFLTGTLTQLEAVWHSYRIAVEIERGLISHTPALFLIDPQGRLRRLFLTQASYAAVPQLGQVLASQASALLPDHPVVHSHLSYATVAGISPARSVRLPRSGGGSVVLGPGRAHLYVFFATWDEQSTPIAGALKLLNSYARDAARQRLPPLSAVDEGSVEPSRAALPAFLRSLGRRLDYPVAIDTTGRVADGYEVQGQPWFVLVSGSGHIAWWQEVYSSGWPTLTALEAEVRAALAKVPTAPAGTRAELGALEGSPAPLAALHQQAARLLGGDGSLEARIKSLRGYPIVLNAWASWCTACQAEFGLLANAAAEYGKRVAFLGADTQDTSTQDAIAFLRSHFVSYPSYQVPSYGALDSIWPPGIIGLPTTLLIDRRGRVVHVQTGEYDSQGSLDGDIGTYLLGG